MDDVRERLQLWYSNLGDEWDAELVDRAFQRGSTLRRRRRTRASVAIALVTIAAVVGVAVDISGRTPAHVHVTSDVTNPAPLPAATTREFADLAMLRAWLAQSMAKNAHEPSLVQAQIVHTTMGAFFAETNPTLRHDPDPTPIYGIQLTGTSFRSGSTGDTTWHPARFVAWKPAIHFVSYLGAGQPIDLGLLGRSYRLVIGHPTQRAPQVPVCGQPNGRPTKITAVVRLDHTIKPGDGFVYSPPADLNATVPVGDALKTVVNDTQFNSPVPAYRWALAANVKATLAVRVAAPHTKGFSSKPTLVWVFSVPSVVAVPLDATWGFASCTSNSVVVDATTNQDLGGGGSSGRSF
jgi:hypothetical protein